MKRVAQRPWNPQQGRKVMDGWDLALLCLAGYAAIVALARLMMRRRNQLVNELLEEAAQQARTNPQPGSSGPSRQGKGG